MEPKIYHGDTPADLPYEVEDIFPEADRFSDYDSLREYISDCLVALAESGKLSVTQIHQQRTKLCDIAGSVILGHGIDSLTHNFQMGMSVPSVLEEYKVRIRALERDGQRQTIKHERGMVPSKKKMGSHRTNKMARVVKEIADYGVEEGEFKLPLAWKILHQQGKYCVPITGAVRQNRNRGAWRVEEVGGVKMRAEKKSPGRPRKDDIQ